MTAYQALRSISTEGMCQYDCNIIQDALHLTPEYRKVTDSIAHFADGNINYEWLIKLILEVELTTAKERV